MLEPAASKAADVTAFEHAGASAERVAVVGAVAGVVSTILHDSVMVPAETVKQRMQLGYYRNAIHCAQAMQQVENTTFYSIFTLVQRYPPYPDSCE